MASRVATFVLMCGSVYGVLANHPCKSNFAQGCASDDTDREILFQTKVHVDLELQDKGQDSSVEKVLSNMDDMPQKSPGSEEEVEDLEEEDDDEDDEKDYKGKGELELEEEKDDEDNDEEEEEYIHVARSGEKEKEQEDVHEENVILLKTTWAQRGAYSQFAPIRNSRRRKTQNRHERLGCQSTAIAQIMFFHRLCPSGDVSFTSPGPNSTFAMDFDKEASQGLCDWGLFAASPPMHDFNDPQMAAVARYEYATSLVTQASFTRRRRAYVSGWGRAMSANIEKHFQVEMERIDGDDPVNVFKDPETLDIVVKDISQGHPLKLRIGCIGGGCGHHVVIDGYRRDGDKFLVHINMGHNGEDDGWYDVTQPIVSHYNSAGERSKPVIYDQLTPIDRVHPQGAQFANAYDLCNRRREGGNCFFRRRSSGIVKTNDSPCNRRRELGHCPTRRRENGKDPMRRRFAR